MFPRHHQDARVGLIVSGELAGSATAVQMPNIACQMVMFVADNGNAGDVYIGGAGVTVADGTTDVTSGYQLKASAQTPWIPCQNMNQLYRICDNAGDDLLYLAIG